MEVELATNQEYRIEVAENQNLRIMVLAGIAEINGQELISEKWYNFSRIITAIFTFTGAKIKIEGTCNLQYHALSSPIPKIFSYYDMLYKTPDLNKTIMVLGHGKTTFCTTISNFFVRMGKSVRYTEIDPSKGNIFPGALSTMIVDSLTEYNTKFKLQRPTCFFYGSTEISNTELYDLQIDALVSSIEETEFKGLHMILAPEFTAENINNLIKKFKVSEVIFIGDERIYNRLDLLCDKFFIENSGYVYQNTVASSINRYFNGAENEYIPCTFIVKHGSPVVRVGEEYIAPDSALPLGATRKVGKTGVNPVEPIENAILAITETTNDSEIPTAKAIGFSLCVDEKKFKILCPQPKLPKSFTLVQGNIKYIDF